MPMTVIDIPRTVIARVHRRHDVVETPGRVRPALQRTVKRLKSHPGATSLPYDAALSSVSDVRSPRW